MDNLSKLARKYQTDKYEEEIWIPALEFEDKYEVSSYGRVKRKDFFQIRKNGTPLKLFEKILKPGTTSGGYLSVCFSRKHKPKSYTLHRVIYESFYGKIPEGMEINHINGNKKDNRLINLETISRSGNVKHYYDVIRNGKPRDSAKPVIMLSINNEIIGKFPSILQAERETGIKAPLIIGVLKGRKITTNKVKWQYDRQII